MNRRGFLSSLAAFVAVPFVPKSKLQSVTVQSGLAQTITLPPPQPGINWTITTTNPNLSGNVFYYVITQ